MTPKGGWRNFYTNPDDIHADAFVTPPPQPSFGPDTGWQPGRYRCLRRVDGRIETILWTVESPTADAYYATRRDDATAETDEPSLEKALAEFHNGSTERFADWLNWTIEDVRTQSDEEE